MFWYMYIQYKYSTVRCLLFSNRALIGCHLHLFLLSLSLPDFLFLLVNTFINTFGHFI